MVFYPELFAFTWRQTLSTVDICYRLPDEIQKATEFKKNIRLTETGLTVSLNAKPDEPFIDVEFFSEIVVEEEIQWEKIDRDLTFQFKKKKSRKWNYLFKKKLDEKELTEGSIKFLKECDGIFEEKQKKIREELKLFLESDEKIQKDIENVDGEKQFALAMSLRMESRTVPEKESMIMLAKAYNAYIKASFCGHSEARIQLYGILNSKQAPWYSQTPNKAQAIHYLRLAALDNEDDWAQYMMAKFVPKKLCLVYLARSARAGNGSSIYELAANLHIDGKTVGFDGKLAENWFEIGLRRGHPKCAFGLGTVLKLDNQMELSEKYHKLANYWDPVACTLPEKPKEKLKEKPKEKKFENQFDAEVENVKVGEGDNDSDDLFDEALDSMTPVIEEVNDNDNDNDDAMTASLLESIANTGDEDGDDDIDSTTISSKLSASQDRSSQILSDSILASISNSSAIPQTKTINEKKKKEKSTPGWMWWGYKKVLEYGIPIVGTWFIYSGIMKRK